jgi:predicted dinucleotide-binding enzyme
MTCRRGATYESRSAGIRNYQPHPRRPTFVEGMMKIAIIGAGNVGTALGSGWTREGHEVTYGVKDPNDKSVQQIQARQPRTSIATNAKATGMADVVVFSTPWEATESAIRDCGSLKDKIVIDATNPLKPDFSGLDRGFDTSGAEQVREWAKGAEVYKTMHQVGFENMDHPVFRSGAKPVMFVAGEGQSTSTVLQLVSELGFETIHVGRLEYARLLEPYAMLWIHVAVVRGLGRKIAFSLLRK